jgi:ribosome-binding protein aMBF1 (putative translation factor)
MNAPWKVGPLDVWWGKDAEGRAAGIKWCGLCGTETVEGVVVRMRGSEVKYTAFFCRECVMLMHDAAVHRTAKFKA